jgi:hypothetical protein
MRVGAGFEAAAVYAQAERFAFVPYHVANLVETPLYFPRRPEPVAPTQEVRGHARVELFPGNREAFERALGPNLAPPAESAYGDEFVSSTRAVVAYRATVEVMRAFQETTQQPALNFLA